MNPEQKRAEKRAAKRRGPPKKERSQDSRMSRLEKEAAQLRKDNQVLIDAVSALRKDYLASMSSLAQETRKVQASLGALFANDRGLASSHDGLADRYFGFIELLREGGEQYAELLTEESLVKYANSYRTKRLEEEKLKREAAELEAKLKAEADKEAAVKQEMDQPPSEPPAEVPDIPPDAQEFGG